MLKDQTGREVSLHQPAKKIVSLVPSITELLFDLGLKDEVIGITKFCIHPNEWFRSKKRIGGTKNIDIDKIQSLQPDLVIANKEENVEEQISALASFTNVYISDISNLQEALQMIADVGRLCDKTISSQEIIQKIEHEFDQLKKVSARKKVLYLIWQKPCMSVGSDTFIHDMLQCCGFENACSNQLRYPQFTDDEIKMLQPDFIFLSSEPFPFKEKHIEQFQSISPTAKVILTDGEYFSWYGSRLMNAPNYFQKLIEQVKSEL